MGPRKIVGVVAFGVFSVLSATKISATGTSGQPWAACLKSHETGIYVTPAFRTDSPNYRRQIDQDAERRWGSSDYVDCDFADSSAEADRLIRNHYTDAVSPWPLPWGSSKNAAKSPVKTPRPKNDSSGGYLVIEDKPTTGKNATARSQTKSTKAPAPKVQTVDKGSNKSKCHVEGKRFVCPASKQ